jgi:hypothetical protein
VNQEKQPKAITTRQLIFYIIASILVAGFFLFLSIPFGMFIILSTDAIKSLIEGIATMLGFFGLIAVYLLTSYDNRIDRLEEKIQDLEDPAKVERFKQIQNKIKIRKKNNTISIIAALGSLVVSFFLSLWILSILDVNPSNPTVTALQYAFIGTIFASTLLFIGVSSIFILIYRIGKEPDEFYFYPKK